MHATVQSLHRKEQRYGAIRRSIRRRRYTRAAGRRDRRGAVRRRGHANAELRTGERLGLKATSRVVRRSRPRAYGSAPPRRRDYPLTTRAGSVWATTLTIASWNL